MLAIIDDDTKKIIGEIVWGTVNLITGHDEGHEQAHWECECGKKGPVSYIEYHDTLKAFELHRENDCEVTKCSRT